MTFAAELEAAAAAAGLDPNLLAALVEKESANDPAAWNPEPRYRYFWNVRTGAPFRPVSELELLAKFPPKDFPALAGDADNEWWGQQASWGLTQIMGAVAREHGYRGKYLPGLVADPAANLAIGAVHLAANVKWAARLYRGLEGGRQAAATRAGLAAYNGGRGGNAPTGPLRSAAYADDVLERFRTFRSQP
jgi:hypothetical protein